MSNSAYRDDVSKELERLVRERVQRLYAAPQLASMTLEAVESWDGEPILRLTLGLDPETDSESAAASMTKDLKLRRAVAASGERRFLNIYRAYTDANSLKKSA